MSARLKQFVQRVLRVAVPSIDVGGAALPPYSGLVSAGGDTVQRLHQAAIVFAQAYNDPAVDEILVGQRAKAVEGLLMAAVTLSVLTEYEGVRLLDELQALLDKHHIPQGR